jgi:hypothetical protein
MAGSLSDLVRNGFALTMRDPCAGEALASAQAGEPALAGLAWSQLTSLMHRRSVPAVRQDDVLAAAIRCYRGGYRGIWAGALLSMLAPALVRTAARVRCHWPEVDSEDLDQQVVLEALRACAEIPLPDGCRYVQRRVVLLANKRLTRWACREARHLTQLIGSESLEEMA